ncbi:hypothetical protein EsH8_V_001079 [Colletotrichum jinshuiense]
MMNHESTDPSTPQRPLPAPLDETVVTPSRLGLLQTPPRRPGRGLKRPIEAEPDDLGHGEASPLRLLQTPPQRPPRRARFSTGLIDSTTLDSADAISDADRPVSSGEDAPRFTPDKEQEEQHQEEHRDADAAERRDENSEDHRDLQLDKETDERPDDKTVEQEENPEKNPEEMHKKMHKEQQKEQLPEELPQKELPQEKLPQEGQQHEQPGDDDHYDLELHHPELFQLDFEHKQLEPWSDFEQTQLESYQPQFPE